MMTMTMIRRVTLVFMLLVVTCAAFSQDDFGIWYNISAEHKLVRKLGLDLSGSVRTFDNASKIDEAFAEAGLSYKINRFLSVGAGYRITDSREKDDSYHARHKWYSEIKGSVSPGDLSLSARFRFEKRYKTYFLDDNDSIPVSHGRYKLKALYDIPSFKINPFISAEIFCPMFSTASRSIDKVRYMIGGQYSIAKRHSVEAAWIFQRDYLPHIKDINIISLSYDLNF